MPKYTVIWLNKKRSKYASFLNISDTVAYRIYPSIFRTKTYSELGKHFQNPVKDLWLSISEFCVTLVYSESWHNQNSKHILNPVK